METEKKKTYGIMPKQKTREQINQEYNHHISSAGHKATTVKLLEEEISDHFERAAALRKEASKLPPEEPKAETAPAVSEVHTPTEGGAA